MTRQDHKEILLSRIHDLFYIENDTLYWKERPLSDFKNNNICKGWNAKLANKKAGGIAGKGYYRICITFEGIRKQYNVHNILWAMRKGSWALGEIDHINHNRLDNRDENLREVTSQGNNKNKSIHINNTTGMTGVTWDKHYKKWRSTIGVNSRRVHLGRFSSFEDAVRARKKAQKQYGFHENHGSELAAQLEALGV